MRRRLTTLRFIPLLAGFLLLSLLAVNPVASQQKPVPIPTVDGKDPKAVRTDNSQFTIPEQRDAREQLKAVMDYLERANIPWDVVTGTAQRLLDAKSDSFFRLKDAKGNETGNVVSVKAKVNEILAKLPKEGRQFYEQEFGPAALDLLKKAVDANYDRLMLADVSQRYFHTKAGGQAALILANVDLEAGQYVEAAYGYQRLTDRPDAAEYLTPRVLLKAAIAMRRSGDPRRGEEAGKLFELMEKNFPRDGLAMGRKVYSLEEIKKEYDRVVDLGQGRNADLYLTNRLGNAAHTSLAEGGTPFLDPAFTPKSMVYRGDEISKYGAEWVLQNLEAAFKKLDPSKREVALPGFFPLTAPGMVIYRTYHGIYAIASYEGFVWQGKPRAVGDVLWISITEGSAQRTMRDFESNVPQQWWNNYWGAQSPKVLFENSNLGSLSQDGKYVYAVDDIAIPPPPQAVNPNMGGVIPQPQANTATSERGAMQNYNRLVALDLDTGKLVWSLGGLETVPLKDEEEAKTSNSQLLTENSYFLGPPLAVNGKIYVLYERKNQIKLGCFDPSRVILIPPAKAGEPFYRYPELVWTQNLGDSATTLRTDTLRRIQSSYLAYADGVMICPTNCGAVVAIDVNSRSLLWARFYGSAPDVRNAPGNVAMPIAPGVRINANGMVMPAQLPIDRWRAATPIIVAGKVLVSPFDSNQLQCFDLRSGQSIWSTEREQDDLYIGGVYQDKVIVVGKKSIRAYLIEGDGQGKAKLAWDKVAIGTPSGHGVMTKDGTYYLPVIGTSIPTEGREPNVLAVNTSKGVVKSSTSFRRKTDPGIDTRQLLGNLFFHDGQLYSQSSLELSAFPLMELKRREMVERLKTNPNDAEGLLAQGEIALDSGEIASAITAFQKVQKNNPSDVVIKKLNQKLYVCYTELLRNKFEDGEIYLAEYEKLCEVPLDSDDASEKQRLFDERIRRKALYLTLVAKGREKQGKLVEAFDLYRAFASLGDNKQLVNVHDEPNGQTRPDVWARGRIDAMIRGATGELRKPLEARVQSDWQALLQKPDLAKLREFVSVFGTAFPEGRQAQLLLAEQLLATKQEDDQREALTHLMQLWSLAEEPALAAKAIENLARLMVRRGQMEDAVGLYQQLGTKFADVSVQPNKTGMDVYADLITDKRLLPYLDAGRIAVMAKYKIETSNGASNRNVSQGFSLNPEGELFPFYRRFGFIVEQNPSGDGTMTFRVNDKNTGEERFKITGLAGLNMNVNMNNFGNATPSVTGMKLSVANGQLLLVNLGQFVYCFDLAEKREVWRENLLGKTNTQSNPLISADGEDDLVFQYEDGWTYRITRSTVLQQTYAAILTRDGLKVMDPTTGRHLWTRTNLTAKTIIFGDERHIYLVDGKTSKVLRAIDGTTVENIPDFAELFGKTNKPIMIGRFIFVKEKVEGKWAFRLYDPMSGKDVWSKNIEQKAELLKTLDTKIVGILTEQGRMEAWDVLTGKTLAQGQVDAEQLTPFVQSESGAFIAKAPLLMLDAERAYLVINRTNDLKRNMRFNGYPMLLRVQPVNGAIVTFDRATGKRLWFNATALSNQQLIVDRFEELPALVAATNSMDDANASQNYRVVALDKRTGRLVHNYSYTFNGSEFVSIARDAKTQSFEFWRLGDGLRLKISPNE
jgi:outer membrane protein assembly factor BamB